MLTFSFFFNYFSVLLHLSPDKVFWQVNKINKKRNGKANKFRKAHKRRKENK